MYFFKSYTICHYKFLNIPCLAFFLTKLTVIVYIHIQETLVISLIHHNRTATIVLPLELVRECGWEIYIVLIELRLVPMMAAVSALRGC